MIKSRENSIGSKAFLIGVFLAIIIGILTSFMPGLASNYSKIIYPLMVILGVIIGLSIDTNERDSQVFLTTGAIIVIVSKFGMESILISVLGQGVSGTIYSIFSALLILFIPATISVAIKTVLKLTNV
ncbi:hypothetical protein GYA25_02120 [Candidatus Woesearchaeota archaeon]|jgi:hypothetical protein|nr:hypothetical protein [Candidatus Woesearchaeota archaeon]